ncbi:BsuPI-related putative proteinase inhibitor, partial [Gottfriedia acidiceleris]|uniref:BsuPI-related putative proteinase inhibitor n=1 Tax=Gottfriedia acidiceleris TaxID=371036 RepID=UPI002FFFC9C3
IEFPTSQFYDYKVYNAQGKQVYHFSKRKFFLQVIQNESLNSGEQIQWKSTWNYKTNDGGSVPAGTYTVHAILEIWKINDKLVNPKPATSFTFNIPPEKQPFYKCKLQEENLFDSNKREQIHTLQKVLS